MMHLGEHSDTVQLKLIPEHPHPVHSREKNYEAILHPPLHLHLDECCYIFGACRRMGPVGYGALKGVPLPYRNRVEWYALLYVGL